jgi:hypothetical protein
VTAGFIVGFDNDTTDVFDKQYDFIVEAGIRRAMVGLLLAMEKTPLYRRLEEEGRLVPGRITSDNSKLATNIVPRRMGYDEMVDGYRELYHRLQTYPTISKRIRNKNRYLSNPVSGNSHSLREFIVVTRKLVAHILRQGGIGGLYHFARSFPVRKRELMAQVFLDWIHELSTRDYIDRHFVRDAVQDRQLAQAHHSRIARSLSGYLQRGRLKVAIKHYDDAISEFWFCINGRLDERFFTRAARQLEKMLRDTRSRLLLQIEEFDVRQLHLLRGMLDRLAGYGDRIRIIADDASRSRIAVDSSLFNLALSPVAVGPAERGNTAPSDLKFDSP